MALVLMAAVVEFYFASEPCHEYNCPNCNYCMIFAILLLLRIGLLTGIT